MTVINGQAGFRTGHRPVPTLRDSWSNFQPICGEQPFIGDLTEFRVSTYSVSQQTHNPRRLSDA